MYASGWFGPDKGSGVFVADGEENVQVIVLRCEGIQGKLGNKMWGHRRPKGRCRIGKIMFRRRGSRFLIKIRIIIPE